MIAARAHPLVLRQLDLVHNLPATRALLPKPLRNVALLARDFKGRSFEDGHVGQARAAVAACTETAPAAFRTRAHSLRVEPVVNTSSIRSTRKSRTSRFFRKRKAPRKFSIRSARSWTVWVVV